MNEAIKTDLPYIFCILSGYLMGTVNFAWLIAKARGFDIRTKGSHNAGTTNAGRTMGLPTGFLVLVALVFFKHGANFARLMAGKELGMRASFAKKKNPGENPEG